MDVRARDAWCARAEALGEGDARRRASALARA
jgi:hypothetical protein